MKRRDLLKELDQFAADNSAEWLFVREGARHSVYSMNGARIPIPRHRELGEQLCDEIRKQAREALGS